METDPVDADHDPADLPPQAALKLNYLDVDLSKVEESLRLLEDDDVDPDDAVAWTNTQPVHTD